MNRTMPIPSRETTVLERRVLAHERVLQALIAYMARTEPRFIVHLRERFVEPISMARHKHEHRETDRYAEEIIRTVVLLGELRALKAKEPDVSDEEPVPPIRVGEQAASADRPVQRDLAAGTRKKLHLGGEGR